MTSVIFFLVVCAAGIGAAVAAIKVVGWFQVELREYRRDGGALPTQPLAACFASHEKARLGMNSGDA